MIQIFYCLLIVFLAGCEGQETVDPKDLQNPILETISEQRPEIDQVVIEEMKRQEIVGLSLAVVENGEITYLRGYGYENYGQKIPMTGSSSQIRWASISKTITGLIGASLSVEENFDLSRDIRSYYHDYVLPKNAAPEDFITTGQLLGHLAGVQHYDNGTAPGTPPTIQTNNSKTNTGIEWALKYWVEHDLLFSPGSSYSYSTFGHNLAGVVMEKFSQKPFLELANEFIFSKLGNPKIRPDYYWENIPHRATGYTKNTSLQTVSSGNDDVSWKLPGGGFISSAQAMGQYCQGILNEQLPTEITQLAWTPQKTLDGNIINYGLGWNIRGIGQELNVYHGGSQQKAKTFLSIYPAKNLCVAVMSNTEYADPATIGRAIETVLKISP